MAKENQEKLISLKEAAEISGYAPDYIGQLIRKGKLPGKQVYYNVAWMTTEAALREYMKGGSGSTAGSEPRTGIKDRAKKMASLFFSENQVLRGARALLLIILGLLVIFIIFLAYVFSANLEKRVNEGFIERAAQEPVTSSQ